MKHKDFQDEYDSDSDSDSDAAPPTYNNDQDDADSFIRNHQRKRRRTGGDAKESAALGIFGSDSEYENSGRWGGVRGKSLRNNVMEFVGADQNMEREEDSDEKEDVNFERNRGFSNNKQFPGLGFVGEQTGTLGASTPQPSDDHPGLGFDVSQPASVSRAHLPPNESVQYISPLGRGFVSSQATMRAAMPKLDPSALSKESTGIARPSAFGSVSKDSRAKTKDDPPPFNPNSFAARMMAKMGHKPGEGLGKQGQGRLEPVAPKVRPQGLGVGAVKELTEQERKEAKRTAALRGDVLSDSASETERKPRRKKGDGFSKGSTSGGTHLRAKEKTKFRTAEEISESIQGLEVPSTFKYIIDCTGKETKHLTSASGLMVQPQSTDMENSKLARMARRDLESFAVEWKGLQDRKAFIDTEEARLGADIDAQGAELKRLREMVDIAKKLDGLSVQQTSGPEAIEALVSQLEVLQFEFNNEIEVHKLADLSVASLHPLFKIALADWDVLEDPFMYRDYFNRLKQLLGVRTKEDLQVEYSKAGYIERSKFATPYENMISSLWLPKIRSAINNDWDVHKPAPILSLLDVWSPVLPSFVQANVLSELVLPKLRTAVAAWNPRLQKKKGTPPPHVWVIQWLPYLGPYMDDLLRSMHTKFGVILDTWDLSKGILDGLETWREVFGEENLERILIRHLLPRLALRLRGEFEVNPADQQLEILEDIFKWSGFFKPSTIGRLFEAEFFPKWLKVLHMWLTAKPDFTEVQEWYLFWQDVFPNDLLSSSSVKAGFRKGLDMMNDALDLGDRAATELSLPVLGPSLTQPKERRPFATTSIPKRTRIEATETTFRDVVEDWCAVNNLLLIPLRKAHEGNGSPLFRITASASGAGGVVCYFRGDVVWCQDRKKNWKPMALVAILELFEDVN